MSYLVEDTDPRTVFTFGYRSKHPAELERWTERLGARVVDIRFEPMSSEQRWTKSRLRERLGERYLHVKALGNRHYRSGRIALVAPRIGAEEVRRRVYDEGDRAILLCACTSVEHCHRVKAAEWVADQTEGHVTEIETQFSLF